MAKLIIKFDELTKKKAGELNKEQLSQAEIAAGSGISQSTISRWMSGKVDRTDFKTIEKLCTYFKCQVNDLLFMDFSQN